ncbi:SusC/RagA family TonB-linked outer membrane protein [Porphyromonas sp. COT-239 OH1446]|uniref:SusC/RagA family TonB-linked outer membrane protein n=1 Tax=Porphyromonas sp. COT-239 OH1446 TaxID=1515613 RepID=UPI00052E0839|nr:SusC/RagA family TonB-linked outer membrane protein [Porphyromonas sp. COT-239 OH1446]KGN71723.1 membrane protein [Porphyromonas sp. COT-239 OH1446]
MKTLLYRLILSLALISSSLTLLAQERQRITGEVKDEFGEPVVGVSVFVSGTKLGTSTDANGRFTLVAEIGQSLKLSSIGFATQIVKITKQHLKITMREDVALTEQLVVNGYQKVKSRVYTGAATSVKMQEIKLDGMADVSRMLEGRVPGLSIQNISGSFGSAPRINIRGGASIIGNVQPLWVIDGAVYEDLVSLSLDQLTSGDAVTLISSAVAGLNPSDIDDIQVLKDASATSVYGARALNGVIVVSTKSGKRNTPNRVYYSSEYSFRLKPSYDDFGLLNSQETMSIYLEMQSKGHFGLRESLYGRRSGVFHQLYKAYTKIDPSTGSFLLPNTPEATRAFLKRHEYANTDWFSELFTLTPTASHNLSFSGGSDQVATRASVSYFHDGGWTLSDQVKRITANLKTDFFLAEAFTASLSAQGNLRQQKAPGTVPQRKNAALGSFERDFDINPFAYALGTSRTLRPRDERGQLEYYRNNWAPFNILNEYENNKMGIDLLDFKLQGELSYKVNKHLEAKALLSVRSAFTSIEHQIHEGSNVVQAFRANETPDVARENIYLLHNRENPLLQPQVALTHGGIYNKTETKLRSYLGRIALDYNRSFGEHDLKGFAFFEVRYADRSINPFQGYGIQYDRGNQIFSNPLIFRKLISEGSHYFSLNNRYERGVTTSWSGTYGYAGKYIVNAVLNYEGSNTAGRSSRSRWLPTWNIGGKWNVDREDFFQKSENLSRLSLRASYGLTAKMNEQALNSSAVFENTIINRLSLEDRENALRIRHLENRDLSWEKMYELNLGLDAAWLNNRITTTIDLYQRNAFDLIDLVRTSGIGGEYYKYANFGDMQTRGLEIALHTKNVVSSLFNWSSSLTLSYMNQRITRLLNTPNTFDMVSGRGRGNIEGFPKGSLFSFNFQGLSDQGLPTFDFGRYPLSSHRFAPSTGADFLDTQYSKSYLLYHGPIEPNLIGGLSNTFRYKGWELSFFITAQAGNKIRLNPTFDPAFGDLNVFSKDYYDRWLVQGDEYKTDVPTLPSVDLIREVGRESLERAYNTYNFSQVRVADGSFVRMKSISLAYALPDRALKALHLHSANIRLNITNPFLIYSDPALRGQDPEFYKSGGVALPTPKQYTLTLNLGL